MNTARSTVYRKLEEFDEFLPGVIITKDNGSVAYNTGKELNEVQIRLIISAILSSKFIPVDDVNQMIERLIRLLPEDRRASFERNKQLYEELSKYSVDIDTYTAVEDLLDAIEHKKNVEFDYLDYMSPYGDLSPNSDYSVKNVSPSRLIPADNRLYLISVLGDGHTVKAFRVDFISGVIERRGKYHELPADFDIGQYISQKRYLSDDPSIVARIIFNTPGVVSRAKEYFGETLDIKDEKGKTVAYIHSSEPAIYRFIMQNAADVSVIEPASLIYIISDSTNRLLFNTRRKQIITDHQFVSFGHLFEQNDGSLYFNETDVNKPTEEDAKNHIRWVLDRNKGYYDFKYVSVSKKTIILKRGNDYGFLIMNIVLMKAIVDVLEKNGFSDGYIKSLKQKYLVSRDDRKDLVELKYTSLAKRGFAGTYDYFYKRMSTFVDRYDSILILRKIAYEIDTEEAYYLL